MKRPVSPLVICAALIFLAVLGCGRLGQRNRATLEAEAKAEKERKEKELYIVDAGDELRPKH